MKHIIACTDGSAYAESVYETTAWAADRTGASVHVLHMLDFHRGRIGFTDPGGNVSMHPGEQLLAQMVEIEARQLQIARERGSLILDRAQARLAELGIAKVVTEQLVGELVDEVVEKEDHADLVVIGKRGETANVASEHIGSNVERVIRASTRPVLVAARNFQEVRSFVLAYDGGPSVEKAMEFLCKEPLLRGAHAHLVRAGKIDDQASWFLHEAEAKLRRAGYEVSAVAQPGEPTEVIAEVVETKGPQLLVMGAYGHSKIRHLIIGSTTTAMIRTCKIPVLMFR